MKNRLLLSLLFASSSFMLTNCFVMSRSTVRFEGLKYPVSGNSIMLDQKGNPLLPDKDYEKKGDITINLSSWAMVYGSVNLSDPLEFGPAINARVEQEGGDGIVNGKIMTRHCALNYFTILVGFLPIVPACSVSSFSGDVVKFKE